MSVLQRQVAKPPHDSQPIFCKLPRPMSELANDFFDVETLRLRESDNKSRPVPRRTPTPKHRPGEKFIKGPIPLAWLSAAASLPGKALAVGVAIWFLVGLHKNNQVRITGGTLKHFNVRRQALYRAIDNLAGAGLIVVRSRRVGACAVVSLQNITLPQLDEPGWDLSTPVVSGQESEAEG